LIFFNKGDKTTHRRLSRSNSTTSLTSTHSLEEHEDYYLINRNFLKLQHLIINRNRDRLFGNININNNTIEPKFRFKNDQQILEYELINDKINKNRFIKREREQNVNDFLC
jgi:hypothetical protein